MAVEDGRFSDGVCRIASFQTMCLGSCFSGWFFPDSVFETTSFKSCNVRDANDRSIYRFNQLDGYEWMVSSCVWRKLGMEIWQ